MLFDRIVEDSLGYIRRKLWSEKSKNGAHHKSFNSTKTISGEFGIIHLLEGRDTPRAIRTWMYTPKRQHLNAAHMVATSVPMDLHIYMDFLGPLPNNTTPSANDEREAEASQRKRGLSVPTHRLQLLKASHFINADGFYSSEIVYWQDVDCFPPPGSNLPPKNKEVLAMRLTDALAFNCLKIAEPLKVKPERWQEIIGQLFEETKARMMNQAS